MRSAERKKLRLMALAAAFVAALAGRALDAQTPVPGAKAMGMGGTFVAAGNDATALWGNPAGLVECTLGCATLFGGASATDENAFLGTLRDNFKGIDPGSLTPAEIAKLVQVLSGLQETGTGAIGSGVAGIGYALHGFGIGIGATVYGGAYPNLILVPEGPFVGPSLDSTVTLKGIEAREIRIGYAGGSHGFTVGGDIRYVQGRTYFATETLEEAADDPISVLRDAFRKNERRTDKVTFDLGATFHALMGRLRLGIVGQNLNEPEFDFADGSRAPLPKTIRAGAAFAPVSFDGIVFSADADLNKQKTLVPGLDSQRIAAGAQIYFVRVGAFRDVEAVDPHWAFTAGLNLPLPAVSIGISGVYSSDKRDLGASAELRIKL